MLGIAQLTNKRVMASWLGVVGSLWINNAIVQGTVMFLKSLNTLMKQESLRLKTINANEPESLYLADSRKSGLLNFC